MAMLVMELRQVNNTLSCYFMILHARDIGIK